MAEINIYIYIYICKQKRVRRAILAMPQSMEKERINERTNERNKYQLAGYYSSAGRSTFTLTSKQHTHLKRRIHHASSSSLLYYLPHQHPVHCGFRHLSLVAWHPCMFLHPHHHHHLFRKNTLRSLSSSWLLALCKFTISTHERSTHPCATMPRYVRTTTNTYNNNTSVFSSSPTV